MSKKSDPLPRRGANAVKLINGFKDFYTTFPSGYLFYYFMVECLPKYKTVLHFYYRSPNGTR